MVEVDGKQCLLLDGNGMRYVIEECEEVEDPKKSNLIVPDNTLIV